MRVRRTRTRDYKIIHLTLLCPCLHECPLGENERGGTQRDVPGLERLKNVLKKDEAYDEPSQEHGDTGQREGQNSKVADAGGTQRNDK